jgi:hypothetical protein
MPERWGFDPLSAAFLGDPFAVLAAPPHDAPVFYAPAIGYYVVTRYADIEAVFLDHKAYSAAAAQLPLVPLVPEAVNILDEAGITAQPSMVASIRRRTADFVRRPCVLLGHSAPRKWSLESVQSSQSC